MGGRGPLYAADAMNQHRTDARAKCGQSLKLMPYPPVGETSSPKHMQIVATVSQFGATFRAFTSRPVIAVQCVIIVRTSGSGLLGMLLS